MKTRAAHLPASLALSAPIWFLAAPATSAQRALLASEQTRKAIDVHHVTQAPRIDGHLDEDVWAQARFVSDLHTLQPIENAVPSRRTEVAFLFDAHALYVGARMYAPKGDVQAVMTRRDEIGSAEVLTISLDTYNDRRTAYNFAVTAAGVRADWFNPDDAQQPRDASFDPVWQAEVTHNANGWFAEMRIPFSQLRFVSGDAAWGVNIGRFVPHTNEDIYWVVVPKAQQAWSSHFGELRGIASIRPSRRIELRPYAAADVTVTSESLVGPDDPFAKRVGLGGRVGLDAKVGLGPSLTLDTTVNPDFGQVEADPAVVNLTAFEPIFEERRPFFVEGSQRLKGMGQILYYSRRIGAAPRGAIDADYYDAPTATRILGAAKVTGKTPSRLSVGAISALTQPMTAQVYDPATELRTQVPVEPLTSYNAVRVDQEVGRNASRIGAMLTGMYSALGDAPNLREQLPGWATTGELGANLRIDDATYEVSGVLAFSAAGGSREAIAARQQNSAHYFQRPDQSHVTLDPTKTSITGWSGGLDVNRRSGAIRWDIGGYAASPGFDPNDMGLLYSADDLAAFGAIEYHFMQPTAWYHAVDLGLSAGQGWNFGLVPTPSQIAVDSAIILPSFWRAHTNWRLLYPGYDDAMTRGGPLVGTGWGTRGQADLTTPPASRSSLSLSMACDANQTGPTGVLLSASLVLRPADRVEVSVGPRYVARRDNRQYIDALQRPGGPTYDHRYVFATVHQRELALQGRLQFAFTPNLALAAYAEPFASSGSYDDFGELPAARSRTMRRYGDDGTTITRTTDGYTITDEGDAFTIPDPDFTVVSFRSTLSLRWEIHPGTTLIVVWQQNRAIALPLAVSPPSTLADSVTAAGTNSFGAKLTYFLPVD